jgi:hypothetical protein
MHSVDNGIDIVRRLAGGRQWWRMRASDLAPWLKKLPTSSARQSESCTDFVGDLWDGFSDLTVGETSVDELGRGIEILQFTEVTPPDHTSVRQCRLGYGSARVLAIDVDFGSFVLPLCIKEKHLRLHDDASVASSAAGMLALIAQVHDRKDAVTKRELRLRRTVEETVGRIGHGAAAIWFRMDPLPFDDVVSSITYRPYVLLLVTLNDQLIWAPVGTRHITTTKAIRDHCGDYRRTQRRRNAALAIIQEHGLRPIDVFAEAAALAAEDRGAGVRFTHGARHETLYHREGTLVPIMGFDGGHYVDGTLTLPGNYPEMMASGVKGKPVSSIVGHPAFRRSGVAVKGGEWHSDRLSFQVKDELIPIEVAEAAIPASFNQPSSDWTTA